MQMRKERFLSALSLTVLLTSLSAVAQVQFPNQASNRLSNQLSSQLIHQLPNSAANSSNSSAEQASRDQAVADVIAAGWMSLEPDGDFRAERALSRAELASILVKAFKLNERQPQPQSPSPSQLSSQSQSPQSQPVLQNMQDVPASHWAYADIQTVLRNQIMSGYRAGRFFPEQRVTRAEAFSIIAQAYGVFQFPEATVSQILQPYSDANEIPSWARKSMATALYEEFVNLKTPQTIAPLDPMTRGDVAHALEVYLRRQHAPADLPWQPGSP
jgi:S-layer homology domain